METLYEVLGVSQDASVSDIKRAYHDAVFRLHPDRNPDPSASDQFIEVEKAYSVLSNEESRKAYDFKISPPSLGMPRPSRFQQHPAFMQGYPSMRRMRRRPNGFSTHMRTGWTIAMCPLCAGKEVIRSFRDGKFVVDPCPQCRYNHKTP